MIDASVTVWCWLICRHSMRCTCTQDPSLERLHATMERIGDVPKPPAGQDESAASWLSRQPGIDATSVCNSTFLFNTYIPSTYITGPLPQRMRAMPTTLDVGCTNSESQR